MGALPLGIIITSDETTDTLIQALELFSSLLTEGSFSGRGKALGPIALMTDNCSELRDALAYMWPNAALLLCSFHILQQVWRWLFEKHHNVSSFDRTEIMMKFKKLVYEKNEELFEELFESFLSSDNVDKYPKLVSYMTNLYEMRASWAHCFRKDLRIRGNNTNNAVEAQFLVLKDSILKRTKEVNINGLFEKLTNGLFEELTNQFDDHYKVKLLNVASGNFDGVYSSRFKGGFNLPDPAKISWTSNLYQKNKTCILFMNQTWIRRTL